MKNDVALNYTQNFTSHLTDNTIQVYYKDQSVYVV